MAKRDGQSKKFEIPVGPGRRVKGYTQKEKSSSNVERKGLKLTYERRKK